MGSFRFQNREQPQYNVPAGDYVLGVEKAELELSKKSGNEQVKLTLRVLTKDGQGPNVFDYLVFGDKSDWKFDVFLKAIKCVPAKDAVIDVNDDWLAANVVGKLGWATLSVDEWQGKKNNKIVAWITNHKQDAYALYSGETAEVKAGEDFK